MLDLGANVLRVDDLHGDPPAEPEVLGTVDIPPSDEGVEVAENLPGRTPRLKAVSKLPKSTPTSGAVADLTSAHGSRPADRRRDSREPRRRPRRRWGLRAGMVTARRAASPSAQASRGAPPSFSARRSLGSAGDTGPAEGVRWPFSPQTEALCFSLDFEQ